MNITGPPPKFHGTRDILRNGEGGRLQERTAVPGHRLGGGTRSGGARLAADALPKFFALEGEVIDQVFDFGKYARHLSGSARLIPGGEAPPTR